MYNIHDSIVELLKEAQELSFGKNINDMYNNEKAMVEKLQEVEELMRPLLRAKMALQSAIEQSKKRRTGLLYVQSLEVRAAELEIQKAVARDKRARTKQSKPKAAPSINSLVASLSPDQANALLAALQGMANK